MESNKNWRTAEEKKNDQTESETIVGYFMSTQHEKIGEKLLNKIRLRPFSFPWTPPPLTVRLFIWSHAVGQFRHWYNYCDHYRSASLLNLCEWTWRLYIFHLQFISFYFFCNLRALVGNCFPRDCIAIRWHHQETTHFLVGLPIYSEIIFSEQLK